MNPANWHLLLNHIPVTGTLFGAPIMGLGFLLKKKELLKTGMGIFIVSGLIAIPVYLTGEGSSDVLQSIGQKNEYFISLHEELAEKAFVLSLAIAALSLLTLLMWRKNAGRSGVFSAIILAAGLANCVLMIAAANAGGQIRHTEIRKANPEKEKGNQLMQSDSLSE